MGSFPCPSLASCSPLNSCLVTRITVEDAGLDLCPLGVRRSSSPPPNLVQYSMGMGENVINPSPVADTRSSGILRSNSHPPSNQHVAAHTPTFNLSLGSKRTSGHLCFRKRIFIQLGLQRCIWGNKWVATVLMLYHDGTLLRAPIIPYLPSRSRRSQNGRTC